MSSFIIRKLIGSEWSHVDIVDSQKNTVIGSTRKKGVGEFSVKSRLNSASKAAIMTIGGVSSGPIIQYAREKEGMDFDWLGLFAILLRCFKLNNKNKYFCSEIVAESFINAGYPIVKEGDEWKVTPQTIWNIGGLGKVHIIREYLK